MRFHHFRGRFLTLLCSCVFSVRFHEINGPRLVKLKHYFWVLCSILCFGKGNSIRLCGISLLLASIISKQNQMSVFLAKEGIMKEELQKISTDNARSVLNAAYYVQKYNASIRTICSIYYRFMFWDTWMEKCGEN